MLHATREQATLTGEPHNVRRSSQTNQARIEGKEKKEQASKGGSDERDGSRGQLTTGIVALSRLDRDCEREPQATSQSVKSAMKRPTTIHVTYKVERGPFWTGNCISWRVLGAYQRSAVHRIASHRIDSIRFDSIRDCWHGTFASTVVLRQDLA